MQAQSAETAVDTMYSTGKEGKYLTFELGGEEYGLEILEVEDTPTFGTKLDTEHISGMAKIEGKVKILLDIDRVLSTSEIPILDSIEK